MKKIPKFIVVIHVKSVEQALEQSAIAFSNGAGGIFLINHQTDYKHLIKVYCEVREKFFDEWIGLNFLDCNAFDAIENRPTACNAIWVDNCYINSSHSISRAASLFERALELGMDKSWKLFGSIAFKYQKQEDNPIYAATVCSKLFSVVVTSGDGTGIAADNDKINKIKLGCGDDAPLALASGVTPENIGNYIKLVDCFMVATGVSDANDNLIPEKVRQIAEYISNFDSKNNS
jgi:hypothetical protein